MGFCTWKICWSLFIYKTDRRACALQPIVQVGFHCGFAIGDCRIYIATLKAFVKMINTLIFVFKRKLTNLYTYFKRVPPFAGYFASQECIFSVNTDMVNTVDSSIRLAAVLDAQSFSQPASSH